MPRESKRGFPYLLYAALLAVGAAAHADEGPEPFLIGIGDVPESARACALKSDDINSCDPNFRRTVEALKKINDAIDSGLQKKARDGIDVALPYNDDRAWFIQAGVHLGVQELTIDEVREDPVRRKIDDERRARNATAGSWVRHTIEVRPRVSLDFNPDKNGPAVINNLLLGFLPQFSVQVQVIKHYDLPVDFPTRPKERAQSFKKLLGEHLKNYLQLPTEVGGGSLEPGESVQLESYLSGAALPSLVNQFAALNVGGFLVGGFTRAGFEYFQTVRYRRYTIQKLTTDKLRMVLETPDTKRWGPFVDVGLSAGLGPFDLNLSLARAGYRWVHEKNFTEEYVVDLTNEEAKKALKRAYLFGDFTTAQKLAEEDCQSNTGVYKTGQTDGKTGDLGTYAHGWRIKLPKLAVGNTHSRTDEVETPVSCSGLGTSITSHTDELQKVRQGFRATRIYNVGIRTLKTRQDGGHSLWVKFNFNGSSSSHDEMLEFLRIAGLVTEMGDDENADKIVKQLELISAQSNDQRTSRVHAYISLEFDAAAITSILSMSEEDRSFALRSAYNRLMGAETPDAYSDPDQYKDHLKDLEKFLEAAKRGVSQPNELAAAKKFLDGIESTGLDLYPFAALLAALPNTDHVVATAQIYLPGETRGDDVLIDPAHAGRLFDQDDPALVEDTNVPSKP